MAVPHQSADLVHSCIIFLLVRVELVVEVVSCTLLGESQVGGEVVDAVMRTSIQLLHPQPLLLYILDQLLELMHAN